MDWSFTLQSFASLLAILNPVSAVPMFLTLTDARDAATTRKIAVIATLTVLVTLVTFMFIGSALLTFFGVSLAAFRVGGGVLLLLMGISFIHGRVSPAKLTAEEAEESLDWQSVSIVPLGIPLLAGPGAISTAIVLGNDAKSFAMRGELVLVIAVVSVSVLAVFLVAERLHKVLGKTGITIAGRVMGLILTAVAVQFMADGLVELFPVLKGPGAAG